jgi:hypothetical protein
MDTESTDPASREGSSQAVLLIEYQANVELWRHDDDLRQRRSANFLSINSVLFATLGVALGLGIDAGPLVLVAGTFALMGVATCWTWRRVLTRNADYVRFRRLQLADIETHLQPASTFTRTYQAFVDHQQVVMPASRRSFEVTARASSTAAEGLLPTLVAGVWAVVLAAVVVMWVS